MGKWTQEEMLRADLEHGPERWKSDTYRLSIPKVGDKDGKRLDVPGWMVGDPELLRTMVDAAEIIRHRVIKP